MHSFSLMPQAAASRLHCLSLTHPQLIPYKGKFQSSLVGETEDLSTISDFRSPSSSDLSQSSDIYCLPWMSAVSELNLAGRQEKEKMQLPALEDWLVKRGDRTPQVKAGEC